MGAAGTDTAIETAGVALMDDDLRKLPQFVRLSRTTHAILVQNITLALGIKAVFLALTLAGKAPCGWRYSPTWAPACWWCSTVCDCCASVSERPHWPPPAPLRWGFFLPWEKHKQAMAYLLGTLPWLPASRSKAPYDELS